MSNCIMHKGARGFRGYGSIKGKPAHRVVYEKYNGPISKGMVIMHTCDVRGCINPSHLKLASQKDNMADMKNKKRSTWGAKNHHAKLDEHDVYGIRILLKSRFKGKDIAAMFNVTAQTISDIKCGRSWYQLETADV